ncbi:MAG: ferredoxin family protein, partial [Myxococcales bacterium]|nr:ferredoxin family protein [Myxococcales bacterium]
DECIDCGACEPACPVQAIYSADDVPAGQTSWVQVNADKTNEGGLDHITETQSPLPTAEAKKAKLGL